MQCCNKCSKILPAICMRALLHRLRVDCSNGSGCTAREMLRTTRSSQNHGRTVKQVLMCAREEREKMHKMFYYSFCYRSLANWFLYWPGAKAEIPISTECCSSFYIFVWFFSCLFWLLGDSSAFLREILPLHLFDPEVNIISSKK